ncbi:MAG: hypothetical protein COW00_12065 [Bdellovibrio sp. CG12_big_fil_rev_8_21_14_0_65_39_13]|nr:MAG: hypothetical protein COW78_15135 [Bdellovibrio sp. CG22_combo_CG10-13_8_21_14_all_39_27]PIQ59113.1 MAG: hypothetical protein COW00_12065 [Bdellovibrio sp. CG12_big_fil_rev_8_21_14_0_65_39_13]PIR33680.1 MAG: hypothetical protein COV37_15460 [Bdellovibrio sp. CG11_big_fil_rev_8_21_14_0_20_39_38]PJB54374.1 MAG: hypothetical protein CO099_01925 [Bdellovibrio sp. CG_4_9_14_3_um_filter_39_7]
MKLFGFCLLIIAYSSSLFANGENTSFTHYNPEKPLALEMVYTAEQTRDYQNFEQDGIYNQLDLSAVYSLTPKDDLRLYGSMLYQSYEDERKGEFTWDLAEFMYRRNNLLNEADHGVQLSIELKNYYLLDVDRRDRYGFDGAFVPQLIFKKHFTRKFITEAKLRHHFYYVNNGKESTLGNEYRAYLTPIYVITRNFFVMTEFKWRHKIREAKTFQPEKTDQVYVRPSMLYLANSKLLVEGYWSTELFKSHDNQVLAENWDKSGVFGLSAYITAF